MPILPGPIHLREEYYFSRMLDPETPDQEFPLCQQFGTTKYSYQWNLSNFLLQNDDENLILPNYGGKSPHRLPVTYISDPTNKQQKKIDGKDFFKESISFALPGDSVLAPFWNEELESLIIPVVFPRGKYDTKIINRSIIDLRGIFGTQLLRIC